MNLSNYLDPNTLSIGFLGGLTCFIAGSIIKNIWFTDSPVNTNIETNIETPTTDTGVDTIRALSNNIPSPTIHIHHPNPDLAEFSAEELRTLQTISDQLAGLNSSSSFHFNIQLPPVTNLNLNIKVVEKTVNVVDLYNAGKLDELNNIVWASAQNSVDLVANTSQFIEFIS